MARLKTWLQGIGTILSKTGDWMGKSVKVGYMPWESSATTASLILQAPLSDQKDLVDRFVTMKQGELSMVAVSSALVASLVTGLMSWSWFPTPPYTARICILCALLNSLMAVGVATQQYVAISRIAIHPEYQTLMLGMLLGQSIKTARNQSAKPSKLQHFAWQVPTMLLGNSIVLVVTGLAIQVFDAAYVAAVWGPDTTTAMCFAVAACFSIGSYLVSWSHMEWKIQHALDDL